MFFGRDIALDAEQLLEIHARCFSLFDAVSLIRPRRGGKLPSISKRELECLKLTANGCTSEEIATALQAVGPHRQPVSLQHRRRSSNAVNRMHAVAKALRMGLID